MAGRSAPIVLEAPAKLNLSLAVLGRRPDGFHEIESLIVGLGLCDGLSVSPSAARASRSGDDPVIRLDVRHAGHLATPSATPVRRPIPIGPDNLVAKAVLALARASGESRGLDIELIKRIPSAAGLGGGSSDAAAALLGAAAVWGIDWPIQRLAAVAADIGSDVPWFIEGTPAIVTGRGERVEPVAPPPPLFAVLACPVAGLSTAEVYRHWHDDNGRAEGSHGRDPVGRGTAARLADALAAGSLREAFAWMFNDLESPARRLCADVDRLLLSMDRWAGCRRQDAETARLGLASPAMLTGSGSACFLLARTATHARAVAARLAAEGWPWVVVTRLKAMGGAARRHRP